MKEAAQCLPSLLSLQDNETDDSTKPPTEVLKQDELLTGMRMIED